MLVNKYYNKKSQTAMILMIIIELILLSLLGVALIGYVTNTTKMDDFKLKVVSRDISLLLSSMYSSDDSITVNYQTPYENKDYFVKIDNAVVSVYKKGYDVKKVFPFVHSRFSKISFNTIRLISFNISKQSINFYISNS